MSDLIERSMNGLTIHLDGEYDCLTTQIGLVENVDRIVICEGDTRFENGELHLNFNKDPSKFCIDEQSYGGTSVKAITFADLSSGLERSGSESPEGDGEVLMILMIENDMPVSTMARAGITATEGITAAMQDLGLACNGLKASGSVKQDIVIVRNRSSDLYLRGAGNHCKLGELIGRAAIGSTRSSASMHHVNMTSRCSIVGRMSEYGYDQDILFGLSGDPDFSHFLMCLLDRDSDPKAVATVSAALYVIDLINWGFTAEDAGKKVLEELLRSGLTEPVISSSPRETLACTVARFLSG